MLDVEGGQGGVLELREAPLERVADELDAPGLDYAVGAVVAGDREIGFFVGNEQAAVGESFV